MKRAPTRATQCSVCELPMRVGKHSDELYYLCYVCAPKYEETANLFYQNNEYAQLTLLDFIHKVMGVRPLSMRDSHLNGAYQWGTKA